MLKFWVQRAKMWSTDVIPHVIPDVIPSLGSFNENVIPDVIPHVIPHFESCDRKCDRRCDPALRVMWSHMWSTMWSPTSSHVIENEFRCDPLAQRSSRHIFFELIWSIPVWGPLGPENFDFWGSKSDVLYIPKGDPPIPIDGDISPSGDISPRRMGIYPHPHWRPSYNVSKTHLVCSDRH